MRIGKPANARWVEVGASECKMWRWVRAIVMWGVPTPAITASSASLASMSSDFALSVFGSKSPFGTVTCKKSHGWLVLGRSSAAQLSSLAGATRECSERVQ